MREESMNRAFVFSGCCRLLSVALASAVPWLDAADVPLVRISGGMALEWTSPAADDPILALIPEQVRDKIVVATIPGKGTLPGFNGGFGQPSDYPIQLFRGNRRLPLARYPNTGNIYITDFSESMGDNVRVNHYTGVMEFAKDKLPALPIWSCYAIMAAATTGWPELPVEIDSTGLPDIIMPMSSLEALQAMRPDMEALAAFSVELDVVGVHAFTLTDDGYTAHVRNFGPRYGIPEESATGTANAALTHYLQRHHLIPSPAECRFLQGEAMQRPSVIVTTAGTDGIVRVGGQCRIIGQGNLRV